MTNKFPPLQETTPAPRERKRTHPVVPPALITALRRAVKEHGEAFVAEVTGVHRTTIRKLATGGQTRARTATIVALGICASGIDAPALVPETAKPPSLDEQADAVALVLVTRAMLRLRESA